MWEWILIGGGYVGLCFFLRWMGAYAEERRAELRRDFPSLRR